MSDTTPVAETTIRTISIKVSRRVDLGYVPFIEYLKRLGNKQAPFGTRDQSNVEFDVFISADMGTNDVVEEVVRSLASRAHNEVSRVMAQLHPEVFGIAVQQDVTEDAFVVGKTIVERVVTEDF